MLQYQGHSFLSTHHNTNCVQTEQHLRCNVRGVSPGIAGGVCEVFDGDTPCPTPLSSPGFPEVGLRSSWQRCPISRLTLVNMTVSRGLTYISRTRELKLTSAYTDDCHHTSYDSAYSIRMHDSLFVASRVHQSQRRPW